MERKRKKKRERRNYATVNGTTSRNERVNPTLPYCVRRHQWRRTNSEMRSAACRTRERKRRRAGPDSDWNDARTQPTSFDVIVIDDDRGRRGGGGSQTLIVCVMTQRAVKSTQSTFTRAQMRMSYVAPNCLASVDAYDTITIPQRHDIIVKKLFHSTATIDGKHSCTLTYPPGPKRVSRSAGTRVRPCAPTSHH